MARSEGDNGKVLDNISFNDGFDMMNRTDDGVSLHMDSDLPAAGHLFVGPIDIIIQSILLQILARPKVWVRS